ncbi:hypothetical protein ACJJI3_03280 [Microbulbifer sp. ZKSA004]|uniref:hypothetical protein n=1 Tax=Microbulbifer sp. ZKSA004 TaxID=3243389 RepID=UPI00403A013A
MSNSIKLNGAHTAPGARIDGCGAAPLSQDAQKVSSTFAKNRQTEVVADVAPSQSQPFSSPRSIDKVDAHTVPGGEKKVLRDLFRGMSDIVSIDNSSSPAEKVKQLKDIIQVADKKLAGGD